MKQPIPLKGTKNGMTPNVLQRRPEGNQKPKKVTVPVKKPMGKSRGR